MPCWGLPATQGKSFIGKSTLKLGFWRSLDQRDQFICRSEDMEWRVTGRPSSWGRMTNRSAALVSGQLMTFDGDELMLSSSVDISELKEVEEAVRRDEMLMRGPIDQPPRLSVHDRHQWNVHAVRWQGAWPLGVAPR